MAKNRNGLHENICHILNIVHQLFPKLLSLKAHTLASMKLANSSLSVHSLEIQFKRFPHFMEPQHKTVSDHCNSKLQSPNPQPQTAFV